MVKSMRQFVCILLVISIIFSIGPYKPVFSQGDSGSDCGATPDDGFTRICADRPLPLPELPTPAPINSAASFEEVIQNTQAMTPLMQELYANLDRRQFDLDDLSASLNYDAEAAINFVRSEIAFEQYPGILRGERGTLIGRAGNAADQALLLRRLLDDAGYETRIARGRLSEDQAVLLITQMAAPRSVPLPVIDEAVLDRVLSQAEAVTGEPMTNLDDLVSPDPAQFYLEATANDTQLILDALAAADISFDDRRLMEQVTEEAQDYFWVQYRVSAFDPWNDAHPAFADPADAPDALEAEASYRGELPEELYHRFRIEVFIEQKQGDELIVHPILTGWEQNAAELLGKPITFRNQPNTFDVLSTDDFQTMLVEADIFLPVINGDLADYAFDLDGNPFGIALVASNIIGATALFQSAAEILEGATGALDELGGTPSTSPDQIRTLTAQWIEYTLIAPDGHETTTRRYVMDRVGMVNREQGIAALQDDGDVLEASKALLVEHIIMVIPTEYDEAYSMERVLEQWLKFAALLSYVGENPDLDVLPTQIMNELGPFHDMAYESATALSSATESSLVSYLPEPMIVVYQDGIVPGQSENTGFERVDVINNTRRVFRIDGDVIQAAPLDSIRQGVWDSYAERVLIRERSGPGFNTFSALDAAAAADVPLLVLSPEDTDRVSELAHGEQTRADVQRDLEAGFVVIIPERPAAEVDPTGWWRVDPLTGETLGITTGGYGQQYVEYLVTFLVGAPFGMIRNAQCRASGGSAGCCFLWGAGVSLGLAGLGFSIGGLLGFKLLGKFLYALTAGTGSMFLAPFHPC